MFKRFIPGLQRPESENIPGPRRRGRGRPSIWQYGSGAWRERLSLPPITRSVTSAPTGSSEPSRWAASNARPNQTRSHGH
jgi:hypothetical protein